MRNNIAIIMLPFLIFFLSPSAHAATTGHIFGQLVDGTTKNTPVVKQSITLQTAQGNTTKDVTSVTTDAHGNFLFDHLNTDKTIQYFIYTNYQGAQYVTDSLDLSTKAEQQVSLTVYDASTDTSKIAIVSGTILLHQPNAQKSIVTVSEFFIFRNIGTHTYVGSFDTSNGKPNALHFSLPHAATNITLGAGFEGYKEVQVDKGFASNAALPPGVSQFAFSFDISYVEASYDFDYTVTYPTVQLSLLVPPSIHAYSSTFTSQGIVTASQLPYQNFQVKALLTNNIVHAQLDGLPSKISGTTTAPASSGSLNMTTLVIILLVMAATVFGSWLYLRSLRRASTVSAKNTSAKSKNEVEKAGKVAQAKPKNVSSKEQKLLQELLELDTSFEAGEIPRSEYQEQRAKTKARLREIMSKKGSS